jgi:serine/threonine protein kinase
VVVDKQGADGGKQGAADDKFAVQRPSPNGGRPFMDEVSETLLEGYRIERKLGSGGMGNVYLVRDTAAGYFYAVKISQFTDRERQRRFLDELLVWIDLPFDSHIAACHFFRTLGTQVAIFSEFVEGGSLADWLADNEISRLGQAIDIAIMSARGITRIHDLNLVHQDIKPGNILVGLDGIAKVTDFGLARGISQALYESETPGQVRISGRSMTIPYRSPEQAALRPVTSATDIWSWAVMMLQVFVGEVTWLDGQVADEVLNCGRMETPLYSCPILYITF